MVALAVDEGDDEDSGEVALLGFRPLKCLWRGTLQMISLSGGGVHVLVQLWWAQLCFLEILHH